jgi:hypothetical protein
VEQAHRVCLCEQPNCSSYSPTSGPHGRCARCGKGRSFGAAPEVLERQRLYATVPVGQRDPVIYQRVCDMAKAEQVAG